MQHDQEKIHFDDLADILKTANARRSADLGQWLKQFINRRREEGVSPAARSTEWRSNQAKA